MRNNKMVLIVIARRCRNRNLLGLRRLGVSKQKALLMLILVMLLSCKLVSPLMGEPASHLPSHKSLTSNGLKNNVRRVKNLLTNPKTEWVMAEKGVEAEKGEKKAAENKNLHQFFIARIEKVRENVRDIEIYKSFIIDGENKEAARFLKEEGYPATGVPLMPELMPIAHMFKPTDMEGQNELKRLNLALDGLAQSERGKEFAPMFKGLSATTEKGVKGMQPADKAHIEDLLVNKIIIPNSSAKARDSMVMGSFIIGATEKPEKITTETPDRRIRSFKGQDNGAAQVKTFITMSYLIASNEWAEANGLRPINLKKYLPEEHVKAIDAEKSLIAANGDGVANNQQAKSPTELNAPKSAVVLEKQ